MPSPGESRVSPARRAVFQALVRPAQGDPADEDFFDLEPAFENLADNDRALAARIYRGVLQNLRLLDHFLDRTRTFRPAKTPLPLRWLLRIAAYQKIFLSTIPDYAIVQQAVEQARAAGGEKAAGFINGVLRNALPLLPASETAVDSNLAAEWGERIAPELRYSVPTELAGVLAQAYGSDVLESVLRAANADETPVWLRVNRLRTDAPALRAALAAEGVQTADPVAGGLALLWIPGPVKPWRTRAWARGELTVQDLGAMLAVPLLNPGPDERVTDWCAAPGGKTGQLWEAMGGRGELYAYEPNLQRRRVLAASLERLYGPDHGIRLLGQIVAPGDGDPAPPLSDAVLVDAPCLGLGLIRRHPEVRWDNRLQQLKRIARTQTFILNAASQHVAPGGRLLWVTCSPTRFEIEERIGSWLDSHPDFEPVEVRGRLPEWARPWTVADGPFLRTRPDLERVDGFGLALLRRRPIRARPSSPST